MSHKSTAAPHQNRKNSVQFHDVLTGIAALAGVLGLIWLAHYLARRTSLPRAAEAGRLRILQSLAIDPRRRLVFLECDGAPILLLTGGPEDLILSRPIALSSQGMELPA
jgi:flagellar biogenesis protein FliO